LSLPDPNETALFFAVNTVESSGAFHENEPELFGFYEIMA
jgi:hypothetical protein